MSAENNLLKFIRAEVDEGHCIGLTNAEARELLTLIGKPAHEREPPHCSTCACQAPDGAVETGGKIA